MISIHLPNEAYQLAAEHGLGEPIRMYRTNKRRWFKILGWVIAATFLFLIILVLIQTPSPFRFTHLNLLLYSILTVIMLFVTLIFFVPLLLLPKTTIYICSSGFIMHRKKKYRVVHWEDVEWVMADNNERCVVYLANKERVILSQLIDHLAKLAQEIELKARLIKRPEGRENLELQFESLLSSLTARNQEKYAYLQGKTKSLEKTIPERIFRIQEESQLGEVVATYYGGFKGILRREAVGLPIYYLLLLACALLFINEFVHVFYTSNGSFLALIVFFLLSSLFMPRFSARFIRLHLYTEGFIYNDGSSFEVVRWEQIEKVIYHKVMPVFSPPFCHIYLINGDTLTVSGYIHEPSVVKQIFDEHVVNKVQFG